MKLPSPLDALDPAKIPEDAKAAWKASGFDGRDVVAVLGEHPDATGEVWHLPNDPRTRTTRELVEIVYRLAGQRRARVSGTPA